MMKKLLAFIFFLFCFCSIQAQSQVNHKPVDSTKKGPDYLFGFNGKKKNDSTLITVNGSTIVFHKSENQISVQMPSDKDPFKKMEEAWNNTEKDAKKDAAPFLKQVQYAPIAKALIDAYKRVKEEYKPIVTNVIQLPKETPEEKFDRNLTQKMLAACPVVEADYKEVLDFIKKHLHDQTFDVPPPPYMDYENCWSCHPSKQIAYDTLEEHYIRDVFKEEGRLTRIALGLAKQKALLGIDGSGDLDPRNSFDQVILKILGDGNEPTTCTWIWDTNPWDAACDVLYLAFEKADYLFHKYRRDFHRLPVVTKMLLETERQNELMGRGEGDYVLNEVAAAVDYFCSMYNERLFIDKDFTQWPNMGFLLGLARQVALLGGDGGQDEDVINSFQKYDRFKLSMDVDIKIGKDGGYELAHLQGDNYVALVPDSDTLHCLRMVLAEDGENPLVPSEVPKTSVLKMKVLNARIIGSGPVPKFIGPYEWQTSLPTLVLHQCDNGTDSMSVNPFYPKNYGAETWYYQGIGNRPSGIIQGLLGAILSSKTEVERMQDPKYQEEIKKNLLANQKQVLAMAKKMQAQMNQFDKNPGVDSYQKLADLKATIHKSLMPMPNLGGKLTFVIPINPKGPTMLDITYDARKEAMAKEAIVYANFKLKMVMERKR